MNVEAVTIDAYGTLVTLRDPVPALHAALQARGVVRSEQEVADAFAVEVEHYVARSHEGRDATTLACLRRDCAAVFLSAARTPIDPDTFVADFIASLRFREIAGAASACRRLAASGLRLAVVSNWDIGLHEHLAALGLDRLVDLVITSAEAGVAKPDPGIWELVLARLGIAAAGTVHVGDSVEDADGALAAGIRFEPAPLAEACDRILA